jgi:hypothetical protein
MTDKTDDVVRQMEEAEGAAPAVGAEATLRPGLLPQVAHAIAITRCPGEGCVHGSDCERVYVQLADKNGVPFAHVTLLPHEAYRVGQDICDEADAAREARAVRRSVRKH